MATRKKSIEDIAEQRNRILRMTQARAEEALQSGNRAEANRQANRFWNAVNIAGKYIGNIQRKKSQTNLGKKWLAAESRGDKAEQIRLTEQSRNIKYSQNSYRGLNKG